MNGPTISGTSGYTQQADKKFQQFEAAATITAGLAVGLQVGATGDGIKVILATAAVPPIGVAVEGGASGDFIQVQTYGPNVVGITTNDSVAQGDVVYSIAAGVAAGVTVANFVATLTACKLGYAMLADGGTTAAAGTIFISPFMG